MSEQTDGLDDQAREAQIRKYWRADNPWYSPETVRWLLGRLDEARAQRDQWRELADSATGLKDRLENAIRTFTTLHETASGRTCQCRLCQMFREALHGEALP